jgi:molybdenum cofactor cytidylyltransferase
MKTDDLPTLVAIVLAAGQSRRMGRSKLDLPWAGSTVIAHVVQTLALGAKDHGLNRIIVVLGGAHQQVAHALSATALDVQLQFQFNHEYATSDMSASLKSGLRCLNNESAAMVVLGDQPQLRSDVVELLAQTYQATRAPLIVPSFKMQRGHPWIIDRRLWAELLELPAEFTLRHFLSLRADQIYYVNVTTSTILQDLDTPEDYQNYAPQSSSH